MPVGKLVAFIHTSKQMDKILVTKKYGGFKVNINFLKKKFKQLKLQKMSQNFLPGNK